MRGAIFKQEIGIIANNKIKIRIICLTKNRHEAMHSIKSETGLSIIYSYSSHVKYEILYNHYTGLSIGDTVNRRRHAPKEESLLHQEKKRRGDAVTLLLSE